MINNLKELLDHYYASTPYEFGRSMYKYNDCGPWVEFLAENGNVYYEDKDARDFISDCTGIKIGSIVEGSDQYAEPITLTFPFTNDDVNVALEEIQNVCNFYWERDNSEWFLLRYKENGKQYSFHTTWGEVHWDNKPQKNIKEMVEKWCDDGANMTWNDSFGTQTHPCDTWFPIGKGWQVMQYEYDVDYYF